MSYSTKVHSLLKIAMMLNKLEIDTYKLFQTQHGITPLTMACQNGHIGIATRLISHGADVNKHDVKVSFSAIQFSR